MSEQLNEKCSICGGYLFSDDDIVYCPDCGAPHHRDCWIAVGHCGLQQYHGTENQFKSNSEPQKEQLNEKQETVGRCANCGKKLPQGSNFCPFCGFDIDNKSTDNDSEPEFISLQMGAGGIKIDPYGGVDKNSNIDGVKVRDLARFIAFMPNRILPKFKRFLDTGKHISWNWIAFLSPYSHSLFRKMNGAFFAYLILELTAYVLITPFYNLFLSADLPINYTVTQLSEYIANNSEKLLNPAALVLALAGIALFVGIRVYAGMFNDWLYKQHTVSTIKKIRADLDADDKMQMRKKGGVRPFLSMALFMLSIYYGSYVPIIISNLIFG